MSKFEVALKPSAVHDMDKLHKYDAAMVADGMEKHLIHEPDKESKSRIKKLRCIENPDYRLRIRVDRVFYNIEDSERTVIVLMVLHKEKTHKYYEELKK